MKTLISICLVLLVGTFCVLGVYFAIVDHRESARREAEEKKKRQDAIDALETKVSKAKASFLAKYDDFDEDDPKETKKGIERRGRGVIGTLQGAVELLFNPNNNPSQPP